MTGHATFESERFYLLDAKTVQGIANALQNIFQHCKPSSSKILAVVLVSAGLTAAVLLKILNTAKLPFNTAKKYSTPQNGDVHVRDSGSTAKRI